MPKKKLQRRAAAALMLAGIVGMTMSALECGGGDNSSQSELVSIAVSPISPSIAVGATQQFTATGTFTGGGTQNLTSSVTWSSSATGVATIDSAGLATGVSPGSATILASSKPFGGETTLSVEVTRVLVSIVVSPQEASMATGATLQFAATGTYNDGTVGNVTNSVTWTSSETNIATISTGGLATGVSSGGTTITAASGSISGTASLSVTM
jgi:trimeric autotransporter adhesin